MYYTYFFLYISIRARIKIERRNYSYPYYHYIHMFMLFLFSLPFHVSLNFPFFPSRTRMYRCIENITLAYCMHFPITYRIVTDNILHLSQFFGGYKHLLRCIYNKFFLILKASRRESLINCQNLIEFWNSASWRTFIGFYLCGQEIWRKIMAL